MALDPRVPHVSPKNIACFFAARDARVFHVSPKNIACFFAATAPAGGKLAVCGLAHRTRRNIFIGCCLMRAQTTVGRFRAAPRKPTTQAEFSFASRADAAHSHAVFFVAGLERASEDLAGTLTRRLAVSQRKLLPFGPNFSPLTSLRLIGRGTFDPVAYFLFAKREFLGQVLE